MRITFFLLLLMITCIQVQAFDKNKAYISTFNQKTKLTIENNHPVAISTFEIVFKFINENDIALHHSYSIYYSHFDKLDNLRAYTKNPDQNGKLKTIHIKDFKYSNASSRSVFYDDQTQVDIDFLGLAPGSEAVVNYTMSTQELHFTDPMIFGYYLPIENLSYELEVPEEFDISFIEKNMPAGLVKQNMIKNKKSTLYTWQANDIDSYKSYDNAPSYLYYAPHIVYKINSVQLRQEKFSIANSPQDLFNWYIQNIKHVNAQTTPRIQSLADSIAKGATTEIEKVERVYNWVKSNIRYVAFEAGMEGIVPREADAICAKRYGDCKDMSSTQYALLRALKIPAYMVWIGTRRIPYSYSEVPLKNTDNHMIAAYKNKGEWIFLDATDPNGIFGLPADHIQGKQAMIRINDTTYELAYVPVVPATTNQLSETSIFTLQNNDVAIQSTSTYHGLIAGNLANKLHYLTDKEKTDLAKNIIKSVSNNALLQSYTFPEKGFTNKGEIQLQYTIPNYVKEVGQEKYINMFTDKSFMNSHIKEENRIAPFSFEYNSQTNNTYILTIPAGYTISYMPESLSYHHENFGFQISYSVANQQLLCKQEVYANFPDLLMKPELFSAWNTFIKQLNKAYKESVILEKRN